MNDDRSPELQRRGTAYHEVGHAVAALDAGGEFTEATMHHRCVVGITLPNARRLGVVHMAGPEAELIETGADRGRPAHELQVRTGGDSARIVTSETWRAPCNSGGANPNSPDLERPQGEEHHA